MCPAGRFPCRWAWSPPASPAVRPYELAGWRLPMQVGGGADAGLQPVATEQRAGLRGLTEIAPPAGSIRGTGAVYTLSRNSNASFSAVNDVLVRGGKVA